jgi:hypothetical protein
VRPRLDSSPAPRRREVGDEMWAPPGTGSGDGRERGGLASAVGPVGGEQVAARVSWQRKNEGR